MLLLLSLLLFLLDPRFLESPECQCLVFVCRVIVGWSLAASMLSHTQGFKFTGEMLFFCGFPSSGMGGQVAYSLFRWAAWFAPFIRSNVLPPGPWGMSQWGPNSPMGVLPFSPKEAAEVAVQRRTVSAKQGIT